MAKPIALTALLVGCAVAFTAAQPRKSLDIYVVDVEGGNATLFVTPSGESVLIDTGNGGAAGARDAGRIMAAAKDAGLSRIDAAVSSESIWPALVKRGSACPRVAI